MLNNLHYNVGVFSAFKNHSQIEAIVKLLHNDDGTLKKWNDFKTEALKLDHTYNVNWLKTEYHQAITSARAARKWQDIQRTKHLYPNLMYVTVNDERTRELHKNWSGIILPVDHVFWNTHFPQNDYGCRCGTRRTDKPIDHKGIEVDNMPDLPLQFNQNVGKTGKIYDDTHPFFATKQYKEVATFAKNALVGFQRKEVRNYLRGANLLNKEFKSQIGVLKISSKGLKELLNQPHSNSYLRNNLLYDIENVVKNAIYIKSQADIKNNPMIKQYHYLLIEVGDEKMYLNVREQVDGTHYLYSITKQLKK